MNIQFMQQNTYSVNMNHKGLSQQHWEIYCITAADRHIEKLSKKIQNKINDLK